MDDGDDGLFNKDGPDEQFDNNADRFVDKYGPRLDNDSGVTTKLRSIENCLTVADDSSYRTFMIRVSSGVRFLSNDELALIDRLFSERFSSIMPTEIIDVD